MPEQEAELGAPAQVELPKPNGAEAIAGSAPVKHRLTTAYWDTRDLRLARWGVSLRHRSGEGWTVGTPSRGEHEFKGGASRPPAAALDLLRAYVRSARLEPVAHLRTRSRGAAEDEVSLRPRPQASPEVATEPVPPDASGGVLVRNAIASSVIRLLRHDAGIRLGGDSEDVHQARVATRRLRSDLRTFEPLVAAEWATRLRAELGWLADLLGVARDADVMLMRLRAPLETRPDDMRRAAPLFRQLQESRDAAGVKLLEAMAGDRYVELLENLVQASQQPGLTEEAEQPALTTLPAQVAGAWSRLKSAVDEMPDPPGDDELHRVRILAKRSRYAAEAIAPVVGKRAATFAAATADLQTVLGDQHDAVVMLAWLRARTAGLSPRTAFVAGMLAEHERALADELRDDWRAAWKKLARGKHREWMSAS
jgi:CHAD domain-containing protein